jgi:hypothetical protein
MCEIETQKLSIGLTTTAVKKIQIILFHFFRKSENLSAMRKNFWRAIYDTAY